MCVVLYVFVSMCLFGTMNFLKWEKFNVTPMVVIFAMVGDTYFFCVWKTHHSHLMQRAMRHYVFYFIFNVNVQMYLVYEIIINKIERTMV